MPPAEITHSVRYIGQLDVGGEGGIDLIAGAIQSILGEKQSPSTYMPVQMRLGELRLKLLRSFMVS